MAKENNVESKSVLEKAILEYKQILEVAKGKIAESHTNELNEMVTKLIKENDLSQYKEPEMVNEESLPEMINQESAVAGAPEAINMKEASMKEIEEAFDAASDDDEFQVVKTDDNGEDFSLSDIESEISEVMSEIEAAENVEAQPEEVDNLTKIKQIHEEMGKLINVMDAEKNDIAMREQFHSKMTETFGEGYEEKIGTNECSKMYETFKGKLNETVTDASVDAPRATAIAPNTKPVVAEEISGEAIIPKTNTTGVKGTFIPNPLATKSSVQTVAAEKPMELVGLAEEEGSVEETHGVGLSLNKLVSGTEAPQIESKPYAKNKIRLALRTEGNEILQKRINSLVNENFELNKQANKAKETVKEITKINESYKEAIDKYRKQLNEMALVSTNIANVNNILVNESLALSFEDKKNMINEFKKVSTVEESEKTYKKIIKEFSDAKKTIKESVEEKINNAIESSSSEEVKNGVEGKQINEHVNKIKNLINYKHKN